MESDHEVRIRALEHLVEEIKARIRALEKRLIQAEQSLDQRWMHAQ